MNLIEALKKYDKVTCDELIDICRNNEYYFCNEPFNQNINCYKSDCLGWKTDHIHFITTKTVLFSNSYREWKESR